MHRDVISRRCVIALLCSVSAALHGSGRPFPTKRPTAKLKRGVAIHNALNWPQKTSNIDYIWPAFPEALDRLPVDILRAAGFDFLRLTFNPAILAECVGVNCTQIISLLKTCIRKVLTSGLNLVLDIHPVAQDRFFATDLLLEPLSSKIRRDVTNVQVILARILAEFPPERVALELWNEPAISPARRAEWPSAQAMSYRAVRASAPELTLILSGIGGGRDDLIRLHIDDDDLNSYYTFHYYDPMPFTHQGLVNSANKQNPEQFFSSVPFPLTSADVDKAISDAIQRAVAFTHGDPAMTNNLVAELRRYERYLRRTLDGTAVARQFDLVVDWALANKIAPERILLGEFGVGRSHVDPVARLQWIAIVRQQAERCGFPWCRWSYDNPRSMGMKKINDPGFSDGELAALGL